MTTKSIWDICQPTRQQRKGSAYFNRGSDLRSAQSQVQTKGEVEITVDSSTCVTVMPRCLCEGISIMRNRVSREGAEYEVASGAHISHFRERRCEMMTRGSRSCKRIVFQVADVHKPLLSISGCADMGFYCTWVTKAVTFWTNTPVSRYLSSAERISTSCGLG